MAGGNRHHCTCGSVNTGRCLAKGCMALCEHRDCRKNSRAFSVATQDCSLHPYTEGWNLKYKPEDYGRFERLRRPETIPEQREEEERAQREEARPGEENIDHACAKKQKKKKSNFPQRR